MPFLKQVTPLWDRSTMTLAELAQQCNISESSASRYLSGKISPPADIAERILEVLGADIVASGTPEEKPAAAVPPVLQIWEVYKDEIEILQATHANHIASIQASHSNHVSAIKENYSTQISALQRDKLWLFITLLVMICLLLYFILDGLHGEWGIIRYAMASGKYAMAAGGIV